MSGEKNIRCYLLQEAARAIAPLVGGCAGAVAGPAGAAVGAAVGVALESKVCRAVSFCAEKAFEFFAPKIVGRWLDWLRGKPRAEQLAAIAELGTLPAEEARREAAAAIDQLAPASSPEDRTLALEYLAAIPPTAARSLVRDHDTGTVTVSQAIAPESRESLLQLLPTTLPPYPPGSPLPGTPYRLGELLGTGGFGAVYKATDPGLQYLTFAIKFCLDPSMVDVLQQERKNLDRLMAAGRGDWSERLVRLYGYNLDHATPFLVYEYVEGGDLASALAVQKQATGRGFAPDRALALIAQVTEGLTFAHQRGLVHRDLKPANVLLTQARSASDGTGPLAGASGLCGQAIKLADFGIGGVVAAHALDAGSAAALSGPRSMADRVSVYRGAGTPLYMSPEQRRGEPADPRQDLFSLGVLWYQLLIGDVTRQLHPGWADELAEEFHTPAEHIDLIRRCVGWVKQRPAHAGEFLALLRGTAKASELAAGGAGTDQPRPPSVEPSRPAPEKTAAGVGNDRPVFRKALLLTRLKQLQTCHRDVARAPLPAFMALVIGVAVLCLALLVGYLVGGAVYALCYFGFRTSGKEDWLYAVAIAGGILAAGAFIWVNVWATKRTTRNRMQHARQQLQAKIQEISTDFPDEVRSWGGVATLDDPDVVAELIPFVQRDG